MPIHPMKSEDTWQAEADMHTIMAAEEIQANPKRMAAAKNVAKDRAAVLLAFAGESSGPDELRQGFRRIG